MMDLFIAFLASPYYLLPLLFCAVGYTLRTNRNVKKDRIRRSKDGFYVPTDLVGDVVGRAIVTIIPLGNIWAAMFNIAPDVLELFYGWLLKVLDKPLVPPLKK
jgi:uncharacterized membrane protein YbjE (DUF340 family)